MFVLETTSTKLFLPRTKSETEQKIISFRSQIFIRIKFQYQVKVGCEEAGEMKLAKLRRGGRTTSIFARIHCRGQQPRSQLPTISLALEAQKDCKGGGRSLEHAQWVDCGGNSAKQTA